MSRTSKDVRGIIPAIVTPFHDDETLDLDGVRAHTRRMLDAGVHGIFPLGTNGEFFVLDDAEKLQVVEAVAEEVNGAVPIYAGTASISTRDSIRMAKDLKSAGAEILSVVSPYFAAASQEELYRHFATIAEASDLPILLYNIPARTGVSIAPATVARLAQVDGVIGAKDSSGNFDNILQYLEVTDRENFAVISGNDSLILWNLMAGGAGGITGVANVYPATMVAIFEEWKAGNLEEARRVQDSIRPIRNAFRHGNPNTVVKQATNYAGSPVGPCRAPFNYLSEDALADIRTTVEADKAQGLA